MSTAIETRGTVLGVFKNRKNAEDAVRALKKEGFDETQLGLATPAAETEVSYDGSAKTAAAGAAIGLSTGALWGLGIAAGILPGIGPAIAGGTLAAILSSAAVGAGTIGLAGAFLGLGFGSEDAAEAEKEFRAGKTIVAVRPGDRENVAREILERYRWIEEGAPPMNPEA